MSTNDRCNAFWANYSLTTFCFVLFLLAASLWWPFAFTVQEFQQTKVMETVCNKYFLVDSLCYDYNATIENCLYQKSDINFQKQQASDFGPGLPQSCYVLKNRYPTSSFTTAAREINNGTYVTIILLVFVIGFIQLFFGYLFLVQFWSNIRSKFCSV